MADTKWYLDFDGVLCDSIPEIWAVSNTAIHGHYVPWNDTDTDLQKRFLRLRAFVRRGAEYLSIIRLMQNHADTEIVDFSDWENYLQRLGPEVIERDHETLYAIRRQWLEDDPSGWLSLNPPYPGIPQTLNRIQDSPRVIVLSTKKPDYIQAILQSWGVAWPRDRIWEAKGHKAQFLESLREPYVLVDDQIEQLSDATKYGRCVLALWGPITPSAIERAEHRWGLEEFQARLINDLATACPPGGYSSPRE